MIKLLLTTFVTLNLHANDKLDQVHQNAKNAQLNLDHWNQNSSIAQKNLDSISKALEQNRELQKKWKANFEKVKSQLSEIDEAEQLLNSQKNEEENLASQEAKQIIELESLLEKIKSQHEKRKENLKNAQKLKDTYNEAKKNLKLTFDEQISIRNNLVAQEKTLVNDGNEWAKKKQESDRNVTKWKQLVEYHDKLKMNYDRLSENKD
jgi:chromosome segregation ATPase